MHIICLKYVRWAWQKLPYMHIQGMLVLDLVSSVELIHMK